MTDVPYCFTRITNQKATQYFADGKHKFYLEYCCHRPCVEGTNKCISCHKIHSGARSQFDSTYPHGSIHEPIPEHSHIFGGTWYQDRIALWGAPSAEVIALALQHQEEVHRYRTTVSLSKANQPFISQEMAKSKKATNEVANEMANEMANETVVSTSNKPPVKRTRKPKIGTIVSTTQVEASNEASNEAVEVVEEVKPAEQKPKRKPAKSTKKSKETPTISLNEPTICKEVVIPTHIEHTIETVDIDGYDIEYVPLTCIEINHTTYFRDAKKNKLYQKIKDKIIGSYVGRYCPHTETICTDVPDSDEENDS